MRVSFFIFIQDGPHYVDNEDRYDILLILLKNVHNILYFDKFFA
jgi:hypothetical protein